MPLPSTMTPIANAILLSTSTSFTFSNIPQGYTDLVVSGYVLTNGLQGDIAVEFNSTSSTTYSSTWIRGSGAGNAGYGRQSNVSGLRISDLGSPATSAPRSFALINIMGYSNTSIYKNVIARVGNGTTSGSGLDFAVGQWRSTTAVTTLRIHLFGVVMSANSTFTLYGIKAAS